ncbi:MAG: L,D-transpeptidase family protein [Kiritimatiellae bacterium]|nr:L,D-transpeptidase family protein [Kiritimatiellia bacterium]
MKCIFLLIALATFTIPALADEAPPERSPTANPPLATPVTPLPAPEPLEDEELPFKIVIEDVPETADDTPPLAKRDSATPQPLPPAQPAEMLPAKPAPSVKTNPSLKPVSPVKPSSAALSSAPTEAPNPPIAAPTSPASIPEPSTPAVPETEMLTHEEVIVAPMVDVEPNCPHALRPPKAYDREVLMLQIFLDRYNFSCGVIDGVWGDGSLDAMRAWQRSQGRRQTAWVDVPLYVDIATMPEALIRYTITAEDQALVTGPLPATWADRAKMKLLGYESLGACIAERFHTSERTLRRLNPAIINWPEDLAVGTTLTVPNVRQAALEKPARLVVALKECVLAGYDAEGVMRLRFPCSIARKRAHLPEAGVLHVKNMAPAPNYTYDPTNYGQDPSVGKMVVPPGPRNPVGSRWIGLTLSGYGIHGTPKPNSVGRPESRGCFRLTNWNAEKLFELVAPGVPVEVIESLAEVPSVAPSKTDETTLESEE